MPLRFSVASAWSNPPSIFVGFVREVRRIVPLWVSDPAHVFLAQGIDLAFPHQARPSSSNAVDLVLEGPGALRYP